MIWVVLGMHKSGTTLVSQLLHAAGIPMIEAVNDARGYDEGNKMERDSTKRINHALLGSADLFSLDVRPSPGLAPDAALRREMDQLVSALGAEGADWGFKDPRSCLTYEAWRPSLHEHRIVMVFRDPAETWAHYWNGARRKRKWKVFGQYLRSWCDHNGAMLKILQETTVPSLVLEYSRLMNDPAELRRLEAFVGRDIVDTRHAGMYRSRAAGFAYRIACWLHRLRGGADPGALVAQLRAAGRER